MGGGGRVVLSTSSGKDIVGKERWWKWLYQVNGCQWQLV